MVARDSARRGAGGRPPKADEDCTSITVSFGLTPAEKERYDALIDMIRLSRRAVLRGWTMHMLDQIESNPAAVRRILGRYVLDV
jgi:hypothetical protein